MNRSRYWQDGLNALLGLWIIASPWILNGPRTAVVATVPPTHATILNCAIVGTAIVVVAVAALFAFRVWEEMINLVLAAWLIISPWMLEFTPSVALTLNTVLIGILIAVLAGLIVTAEERNFATGSNNAASGRLPPYG